MSLYPSVKSRPAMNASKGSFKNWRNGGGEGDDSDDSDSSSGSDKGSRMRANDNDRWNGSDDDDDEDGNDGMPNEAHAAKKLGLGSKYTLQQVLDLLDSKVEYNKPLVDDENASTDEIAAAHRMKLGLIVLIVLAGAYIIHKKYKKKIAKIATKHGTEEGEEEEE